MKGDKHAAGDPLPRRPLLMCDGSGVVCGLVAMSACVGVAMGLPGFVALSVVVCDAVLVAVCVACVGLVHTHVLLCAVGLVAVCTLAVRVCGGEVAVCTLWSGVCVGEVAVCVVTGVGWCVLVLTSVCAVGGCESVALSAVIIKAPVEVVASLLLCAVGLVHTPMLLCAVGLPGFVALSAVEHTTVLVAASVPCIGLVHTPMLLCAVGLVVVCTLARATEAVFVLTLECAVGLTGLVALSVISIRAAVVVAASVLCVGLVHTPMLLCAVGLVVVCTLAKATAVVLVLTLN